MDWAGFERHILSSHSGKPQEVAKAERAIKLAKEGLDALAQMGHQFHLASGPGEAFAKWPRLVYHVHSAPNGRLVYSQFELIDLGEGWFDTLEEAQHREGVAGQMRGRGGVSRRSLPVPTEPFVPVEARLAEKAAKWREEREKKNGKAS